MQLMASVDFVAALAKDRILIRRLWAYSVEKLTASLEQVGLAEYFSSKAPFRKQLFPIGL
jgi:hypothetical protein